MNKSLLKSRQTFFDLYVFLMFLVFPLFILPSGYKNITAAKYWFFATATLLFSAAKLYFIIKDRKIKKAFSLSPSDLCVIFYFIFSSLSACLSPYGAAVLRGTGRQEGLITIALYCLCFFILSGQSFKGDYVFYLAASALIFSLITLVQFCDKNPFGFYPSGYYYYAAADVYTASFVGTLGNVGMAATFISVCVPLFFAYYLKSDEKKALILPFVSFLLFFILLYTDVDAGKVAVFFACVYVCFAFSESSGFKKLCRFLSLLTLAAALNALLEKNYVYPSLKVSLSPSPLFALLAFLTLCLYAASFLKVKNVKLLLCVVLVIFIISGLVFTYFYSGESRLLFEAKELLHGRISDSFGSNRILIWKDCLRLFREKPLFGQGPDTLYKRTGVIFERTSDISGALIRRSVDSAHNEYLNVLVNQGIFAFVSFSGIVLFSLLSKEKLPKAAFTGYAVCAFFSFSVCITAPFFWIFAAFLSRRKE